MSEPVSDASGVFKSLHRLLNTGLLLVRNRVELITVELQEERCRFAEAIMLTAAVVALGIMTFTLLTLAIVVYFWEGARLACLFGLSTLYLGLAILAFRMLTRRLQSRSSFSATLQELKKDQSCLETLTSPDSNSKSGS